MLINCLIRLAVEKRGEDYLSFPQRAAGDPRTAHPNAYIGVHQAADHDGRQSYKSREATRAMVEFARQLGVSSTITDKMGRTPSDSLEWLSSRDLRSMGATVSNKYQPSNEAAQSN